MAEVEVFPVAVGVYAHHPHLDVDPEVEVVTDLLADFGGVVVGWDTPAAERGDDAIGQRLRQWSSSAPGDAVLYWVGHGESDHRAAYLAHAQSPKPIGAEGIDPRRLAYHVARHEDAGADQSWTIVIVDTCKSARFVELLNAALDDLQSARRLLLIGTSGEGSTSLGRFSFALRTALDDIYRANETVELWDLGKQLKRLLPGAAVVAKNVETATLRRRTPLPAGFTATVDVVAEIEAVLAALSDDEIRHFVPKAQGAELGEISWYFEGRETERRRIVTWLRDRRDGLLVVTGKAGSGKSALLGNVLVYSQYRVRDALVRHGLIQSLDDDQQPPDGVFDAALHLTGLATPDIVHRLAVAFDLGTPPDVGHADWLCERMTAATILMDALDEAVDPLTIARSIIRPLAAIPSVRVVVGTRRSTAEGPDRPDPVDQDLLDALGTADVLSVERDEEALIRYVRNRLTAAEHRLGVDRTVIEAVSWEVGVNGKEFLFARLAVHELLAEGTLLTLDTARPLLLGGDHRSLFAKAVDRLAAANPAYRPLLSALAFSQGRGLPIRDGVWTSVALSLTPDIPVTDATIAALVKAGAPYLMLDTEHGQTVYRLAHRTFQEHLTSDSNRAAEAHNQITRGLVAAAEQTDGLNPYLQTYLSAHAGAGGRDAWRCLGEHPMVIDRLDPKAVAADAMRTAFARFPLPPEIGAVIGAGHQLATAAPADRAGLRQLAMARHAAIARPADRPHENRHLPWSVHWADFVQRPPHRTLTGHTNPVTGIVVLPDRKRTLLAAMAGDGTIRTWDPITGDQVGPVIVAAQATSPTSLAGFAIAGRPVFAIGGSNGTVRIRNAVTGSDAAPTITAGTGAICALAAFVDRTRRTVLATGCADGTVRIWHPLTGREAGPALFASCQISALATYIGRVGRPLLAAGGVDGTVRIWDPATGSRVGPALGGRAGWAEVVIALADADGRPLLATSGLDHVVRVWDPAAGKRVGRDLNDAYGMTPPVEARAVVALRRSDGRPLLAIRSVAGQLWIWDPVTSRPVGSAMGDQSDAQGVIAEFTGASGQALLATGDSDGAVRIWDPLPSTSTRSDWIERIGTVRATAAFTGIDGQPLLAVANLRGIRVIDPTYGAMTSPFISTRTATQAIAPFAGTDQRRMLAIVGSDNSVRIVSPTRRSRTERILNKSLMAGIKAIAPFSGSGRRSLLATIEDDILRIVDPWKESPVVNITGQPLMATTDPNSDAVHIVDLDTGLSRECGFVAARLAAVVMNTAGHPLLATADGDDILRISDPDTGWLLCSFPLGAVINSLTGIAGVGLAVGTNDGIAILRFGQLGISAFE
ncbi:WD40 repeat domain-containing protein [Actinocrispum wychmicini]|uniref:WD40 repeat protein n=1 Tax=Actinocrispum wychmicini TaxID=1213861 RepID=A0A4R2J5Z2_9PSEU|nr:WD40 repeat domain-containing protein [Actinocrispum wychmicini]TCO54363.1 WD40 repeat protein [Actinocrispum wychmicini]